MQLSVVQKRGLLRDGFVHLPGVVPGVMVERARRLINGSLGELGMDREKLPVLRAQSYCPELRGHEDLLGMLTETPAWGMVESAVGAGKVERVTRVQLALRFPVMTDPPAGPRPHIDGMPGASNGVPAGKIMHFTGLVGILLSDLPAEDSGNFTVWPGMHLAFAERFREQGVESLLRDGMGGMTFPEPRQIMGKAGDAVLCHYLLPHGIAANVSGNIRYAAFFRLLHVDHGTIGDRCMTEPWLEWEGMREVAEGAGKEAGVGADY